MNSRQIKEDHDQYFDTLESPDLGIMANIPTFDFIGANSDNFIEGDLDYPTEYTNTPLDQYPSELNGNEEVHSSNQLVPNISSYSETSPEIIGSLYNSSSSSIQHNIIHFSKADNSNLVNRHNNMSLNTKVNHFSPEFLSPSIVNNNQLRTPSIYSNNSLYSETSSQTNSPAFEVLSQVSVNENPPINLTQNFNSEIELGESISSTNLMNLSRDNNNDNNYNNNNINSNNITNNDYNNTIDNNNDQFHYTYNHQILSQPPLFNFEDFDKQQSLKSQLTENNLLSYNQQLSHENITISVQQPPEVIAAKTPSLFSNSSANSSNHSRTSSSYNINFNKTTSDNKSLTINDIKFPAHSDDDELLNPKEYQSIKRGRKKSYSSKSHSRNSSVNRSRSHSISKDDSDEVSNVNSREKMLELASPNVSSKRTQKHPSVYACHLCDKRFTRPYNLKSHLRTHTDERPFICNICGKAFARQHDRKRHEDLHTGEKKFQCKGLLKNGEVYGCGRKFARADALRRHFQTEAGKECIRLLIEEEKIEKLNNPDFEVKDSQDYLSTTPYEIPQVAISPPE